VSSRRGWVLGAAIVAFVLALVAVGLGARWISGHDKRVNVADNVDPTKGVVSGKLFLASGPLPLKPLAGQVGFANVAQISGAWTPEVVPTATDGTFSVSLSPGLYQIGATSADAEQRCISLRRTVRVRAGDAVHVNVQCLTGWP
jgi:hypothetical protein